MPHVKRVRRVAAADASPESLKVVLCRVGVSAAGAADWPAAAAALVERHALTPERAQVPGLAPRTREQWEAWTRVWPIAWQKPNRHLGADAEAVAPEAAAEMRRFMSRALLEATARGVSEGVLAHDAHNSYHYADAGRLYELEMLLNAFAIASRRQP